jgi:hypothetical protein
VREAVERTGGSAGRTFGIRLPGTLAGVLEIAHNDGVDLRVEAVDAVDVELGEFERRDLAALKGCEHLGGGSEGIGHANLTVFRPGEAGGGE